MRARLSERDQAIVDAYEPAFQHDPPDSQETTARLAKLAERTGDHLAELRERRAIVALDPPDPLDAHYELAKALANSGDVAGARRELLGVLEQAPAFEKAQTLLLALKNRSAPPVSP